MKKIRMGLATGSAIVALLAPSAEAQQRTILRSQVYSDAPQLAMPAGIEYRPGLGPIQIRPGEYLVDTLPQQAASVKLGDGRVRHVLPLKIFAVDSQGVNMDLQVAMDDLRGGMILSGDQARFEGEVQVGIVDTADPASDKALQRPIRIFIISDATGGTSPSQIDIGRVNVQFIGVHLASGEPKPVQVRARSSIFRGEQTFCTLAARPALHVACSPKGIYGFGLDTAAVSVNIETIVPGTPIGATVTSGKGELKEHILTLGNNGSATTTLRSIGLGRDTVTATSMKAASGTAVVEFLFPWGFLISTIAGSLIGSIARLLVSKEKRAGHFVRRILLGFLLGLLTTSAYAVGVNVSPIAPKATAGEVLTFVLAGVVSYVGKISLAKKP
jgi:uncharacterized membrane protein YeaQ/YmgE (transglycosylase-associated protein family)